jgi:hypothetical protein
MKVVKIIFGLVSASILLLGGFMAGTFITQMRTANILTQQIAQPAFIPQQQFQPSIAPQQTQTTPIAQATQQSVPSQGQWEPGWMMNPNYAPQGQQGRGMHDWNNGYWGGMHGSMMNGYGWQSNPNWNPTLSVPNGASTYPTPSTSVSFKNDVQPIFASRCIACHGGTNGLFLDTYENVLKGSINGAVVIPSDMYNSRLGYYVYSGYMPFRNTPLTSTEIQTILDWIALGAPNN